MKYAVIKTGGKQYRVSEGETLAIEKLENKEKDSIIFDQILLVSQNNKLFFGQPFLSGFKVKAQVLKQFKDKKLRIAKFRAKSRYRKIKGHRQQKTKIKILQIVSSK